MPMRRVYDDGSMAAMLMRYSSRMGVSRDLIRYAEHISSQTIHFVTPAKWRAGAWRAAISELRGARAVSGNRHIALDLPAPLS